MKKYTGWSVRDRPFSPKEFNNSYLKKNMGINYSRYLTEWGKHYKNKRLRKTLVKKRR